MNDKDKYVKLRNEVIDMQSAIIGWRKKLAFNDESDLIGALETMIERALQVKETKGIYYD